MQKQPLFTADWPWYAVAAHVAFWAASAVLLAAGAGAFAGLVTIQTIVWLFWTVIVAAFLLGIAATLSGRLYVGNQVFARSPLTGLAARLSGAVTAGAAGLLMLMVYGLSTIRGG